MPSETGHGLRHALGSIAHKDLKNPLTAYVIFREGGNLTGG